MSDQGYRGNRGNRDSYRSNSRRGSYPRQRSGSYQGRDSRNRGRNRPYIKKGAPVYLLDILQHGGVDKARHSWDPIAQIISFPDFKMYEVTLNKNKITELKLEEKYPFDIGQDALFIKVNTLLEHDKLTPASARSLHSVIRFYVTAHEERFINFVNKVGPITIKRHYLEVLPGIGKKLMNEIIAQRTVKEFETYEEVHTRVPGFKPIDVITKRIIEELENDDVKHRLFVREKKYQPKSRFDSGNFQKRKSYPPRRSNPR